MEESIMSDNKKLKKAIRARQERTGETYSTARMHVLASLQADGTEARLPPEVVVEPEGLEVQVREVLVLHPDLTHFGFRAEHGRGVGGVSRLDAPERFAEERASLLTKEGIEEVERCAEYLALVRKTRTARSKESRELYGSYGMKHEVEAWLGRNGRSSYVSNGAFIVAAVIAKVPIFRSDPRSPNCVIGVEPEDVRAIREGKIPAEWRRTTAFVKWLFQQAGRGDPIGDLAGDCKADFGFPRRGTVAAIRAYLSRHGDHVIEAFNAARAEYRSRT